MKKQGYVAGASFSRVKLVVFNPGSRDHIADRLMKLRGWKPTKQTDGGKPQVDESVLEGLPWPEAKALNEYLMIEKRIGQVGDGDQAWLVHARDTGIYGIKTDGVIRIHGDVRSNGAVTGRMTHSRPNVAQTPTITAPFGEDCRACYVASPGLVLAGVDADGLELRMLAHFMAIYDGGAYASAVVDGKKEDGSDAHSINQRAAGMTTRDGAKTFVYALIYGAGDYKLGLIAFQDFDEGQRERFLAKYKTYRQRESAIKRLGTTRRAKLMANLPALEKLSDAVKAAVKARGYLKGLDGRLLHVRAEHSALNTLLQSAGALVMKKALCLSDADLAETIRSSGGTAAFVANIHDEFQIETEKENAEFVGTIAAESIRAAGEYFKLRVPLKGNFAVGANWRDTH
jgi:DNA polymerase I-like protein with 3'-5' exonuclease and polymerase domains